MVPAKYLDDKTIYHLQPSGRFVIGGPQVNCTLTLPTNNVYKQKGSNTYNFLIHQGDAGVTGRKIIVDTYGGWGAHGGGAFSGKDFSKVDRSAAYAARWVAKSLVKAKLCRRVLVQVSVTVTTADKHKKGRYINLQFETFPFFLSGHVTGFLCYWSGPSPVCVLVHLRILPENRERAPPHRQQEL